MKNISYLERQLRVGYMTRKGIDVIDEIAKLRGFKGRKRVEKLDDKIKIIDISPKGEWAEYHAKKLGFEGRKKGEKIDGVIVEKGLTPLEEFDEYITKKTGKRPEDIYSLLIPNEEITQGLEILKQKWLASHQKFMEFCREFADKVNQYFEKNKTTSAAIKIEDMFNSLEEYHRTHPGSMNIYSRDDLIIGFSYCMPEKGINARMTANKRAVIFEKIIEEL